VNKWALVMSAKRA